MLTEYGICLKEIRAARGITVRTMAATLGVHPSWIYQLQNGTKNVPPYLTARISRTYSLSASEKKKLEIAEGKAPQKLIKIKGRGLDGDRSYCARQVASKIATLNKKQIAKIITVIDG